MLTSWDFRPANKYYEIGGTLRLKAHLKSAAIFFTMQIEMGTQLWLSNEILGNRHLTAQRAVQLQNVKFEGVKKIHIHVFIEKYLAVQVHTYGISFTFILTSHNLAGPWALMMHK